MKMSITAAMLFVLIGASIAIAAMHIRCEKQKLDIACDRLIGRVIDEEAGHRSYPSYRAYRTNGTDRTDEPREIPPRAKRSIERAAKQAGESDRRLERRMEAFFADGPDATRVTIDMDRIVAIESSGNPRAVNARSGCRGLCQIAEGTWSECVRRMGVDWDWEHDAFQPGENRAVGNFYINTRIPEMLRHYGIADCVETRIGAYNWGIGGRDEDGNPRRLLKAWENWNEKWLEHAPAETQDYVAKYHNHTSR